MKASHHIRKHLFKWKANEEEANLALALHLREDVSFSMKT